MTDEAACSQIVPVSSTHIDWVSDDQVQSDMSKQGRARIGSHYLNQDSRYTATRYSLASYMRDFLGDTQSPRPVRLQPTYHHPTREEIDKMAEIRSEDWQPSARNLLAVKGIGADRERYLQDVHACSVPLSSDDQTRLIAEWARSEDPDVSQLPEGNARKIAHGTAYDRRQIDASQTTSPFHFVRGYYFQAAKSFAVVSGRTDLEDLERRSTEASRCIDTPMRENFGITEKPTESINASNKNRGVLWLPPQDISNVPESERLPQWSFPYNDSFYCGAIQYGRLVFLASARDQAGMFRGKNRPDRAERPSLTVTAREQAMIRGSEAYELHSSQDLGEVFVPVDTRKGSEYGIPQMLESVSKYTDKNSYRESLMWLSDLKSLGLNKGDIVVQTIETRNEDGEWVGLRERNAASWEGDVEV